MLLGFLTISSFFQRLGIQPAVSKDDHWLTTTGQSGVDWGESMEPASGGGYITVAYTQNATTSLWNLAIEKFHEDGSLWWSNLLGIGLSELNCQSVIKEAEDGTYLLSTTTENYSVGDQDALIVNIDVDGTLLSAIAYGGADYDCSEPTLQETDQGIIFTGLTSSYGVTGSWVVNAYRNGTVNWAKKFERLGGYYITNSSSGNYLVTGYTDLLGNTDISVLNLDHEGNVFWAEAIGGSGSEDCSCIQEVINEKGGYVLSRYTNSLSDQQTAAASILRISETGALFWAKILVGSYTNWADYVREVSDGFVLVGWTFSCGSGSGDVLIAKLDKEGDPIYIKSLGGSSDDRGTYFEVDSEENLLISGYTYSYGWGTSDAFFAKLPSDAELTDNDLPPGFELTDCTSEITVGNWTPTVTQLSPTVQDISPTVTDITNLISYEPADITVSWLSPEGDDVDSLVEDGKALKIPGPIVGSSFSNTDDGNSDLGDFNGDGIDDFAISGINYSPDSTPIYFTPAIAYIVYGRTDILNQQSKMTNLTEYLDGTTGFRAVAPYSVGLSVSSAGDVNGDGWPDLIFANVFYNRTSELCAFVLLGGKNVGKTGLINLAELNGTDGFSIYTPIMLSNENAFLYKALAHGIGDFDGDKNDDLAIGTEYWNAWRGVAYIVQGYASIGQRGIFYLNDSEYVMTISDGGQLNALGEGNYFGRVRPAFDVNQDGYSDVLIGASNADAGHKNGYAYHNGTVYVLLGGQWTNKLNVTTMNTSWGFSFDGLGGEELGTSLTGLKDINQDGIDDIMISGPRYREFSTNQPIGQVYVLYGNRNFGLINVSVDLHALKNNEGYTIPGIFTENYYQIANGIAVSPAGYTNINDEAGYIIGSYSSYPDSLGNVHIITDTKNTVTEGYVNYTALTDQQLTTIIASDQNDYFGDTVQFVGDVNADCVDDVLIGAPSADENGKTNSGFVLIYFGNSTGVTHCGVPLVNGIVPSQSVDICSEYSFNAKEYFTYTIPTRNQLKFQAYQTNSTGYKEALPSWLKFNSSAVSFSGEPRYSNQTGTSNITVLLTDYYGQASLSFLLTVNPVYPKLVKQTPNQSVGVGQVLYLPMASSSLQPFDYITECPNEAYFSASVDQNWVTFDSINSVFSGIPVEKSLGITRVRYTITDEYGSENVFFNITVASTLSVDAPNTAQYNEDGSDPIFALPSQCTDVIDDAAYDLSGFTIFAVVSLDPASAGFIKTVTNNTVSYSFRGSEAGANEWVSSLIYYPSNDFQDDCDVTLNVLDSFGQNASKIVRMLYTGNVAVEDSNSHSSLRDLLIKLLESGAIVLLALAVIVGSVGWRNRRIRTAYREAMGMSPVLQDYLGLYAQTYSELIDKTQVENHFKQLQTVLGATEISAMELREAGPKFFGALGCYQQKYPKQVLSTIINIDGLKTQLKGKIQDALQTSNITELTVLQAQLLADLWDAKVINQAAEINPPSQDLKQEWCLEIQSWLKQLSPQNEHEIAVYQALSVCEQALLYLRDQSHENWFVTPRIVSLPSKWYGDLLLIRQERWAATRSKMGCVKLQESIQRYSNWEYVYGVINVLTEIACGAENPEIIQATLLGHRSPRRIGLEQLAQLRLRGKTGEWVRERLLVALNEIRVHCENNQDSLKELLEHIRTIERLLQAPKNYFSLSGSDSLFSIRSTSSASTGGFSMTTPLINTEDDSEKKEITKFNS